MNTLTLRTTLLAALLLLAACPPAPCQWTNDPWNGMVEVCAIGGEQEYPILFPLAGQRTFVAWNDYRYYPHRLYYQVLEQNGCGLLVENGIPIIEGSWTNVYYGAANKNSCLVPNQNGGCSLIFYTETDSTMDIYGQSFDSLGNLLWGTNGIPLVFWPAQAYKRPVDVTFDELGNIFIAYNVVNAGTGLDLYIQKITLAGQFCWGDYGVPAAIANYEQIFPQLVPDNQGGVLCLWIDDRITPYAYYLYFQHLDASGNPLMPVNGSPALYPTGEPILAGYTFYVGVIDGQGGGYWAYCSPGYTNHFFLLHLNGQGQTLWNWTNNGYWQHTLDDLLFHPADSTVWFSVGENPQGTPAHMLYRSDFSGNPLFGTWGIPYGGDMVGVSDGVITLDEQATAQRSRIFANCIDGEGTVLWQNDIALSDNPYPIYPAFSQPVGVSDGNEGAVTVFLDLRNVYQNDLDLSAQRLLWDGTLGTPPTAVPPLQVDPPPDTELNYSDGLISFNIQQASTVSLELYDVLGRKSQAVLGRYYLPGSYQVKIPTEAISSGVYFLNLKTDYDQQVIKEMVAK